MNLLKVGIILKKDSDRPLQVGREMADWLQARGIATETGVIHPDMDLLVILGGDGTLLHVANQASRYQIPVLGINLGYLGFLTEVAEHEMYDTLEAIIAHPPVVENRMMLKARLLKDSGPSGFHYALNDVVISKGSIDQLVQLSTWMDEEFITTHKADGLVFSTPTGSTAYNLSAGGPIVQPELQSILVTPICPFMLESRPILLPPEVVLNTRLAKAASGVKIIVDGRFVWEMTGDDRLEVQRAEKPLLLIGSPKMGYFDILRNKLNWGGGRKSG